MHISKEPVIPPDILYHGTTHKALDAIMNDGLKPMGRQYVHLSGDTDTAIRGGRRRDNDPVILVVDDTPMNLKVVQGLLKQTKIRIDTVEHMNEVIEVMHDKLGDNHHEIGLSEYNIEKYSLFSGEKLIPNPTTVSWVIVGPAGSGTLVVFVCVENQIEPYMYMYYND